MLKLKSGYEKTEIPKVALQTKDQKTAAPTEMIYCGMERGGHAWLCEGHTQAHEGHMEARRDALESGG